MNDEPTQSPPLRVFIASLTVILFAIPCMVFSHAVARTVAASSIAQIAIGTTASALAIFACFVFVFTKLCADELAQALHFRVGALHFIGCTLIGAFASCVALVIILFMGARIGEPTYEKIPALIVACFGGALIEEIVFRGALMALFVRLMPATLAIIIVSILFALVHIDRNTLGLFSVGIAGVCYGLIYLKYRSLWAVIGIHFGWNIVVAMTAGFWVWKPGPFPLTVVRSDPAIGAIFAETAFLLGLLLLLIYKRMKKQSPTS